MLEYFTKWKLNPIFSQIQQMVTGMKESFLIDLVNKNWMDEETKAKAIEKVMYDSSIWLLSDSTIKWLRFGLINFVNWLMFQVASVIDIIGYPDWILDSSALSRYYMNVSILVAINKDRFSKNS